MTSSSLKGGKRKSLKTKRSIKTKRRLNKSNKKSVKGGTSPKVSLLNNRQSKKIIKKKLKKKNKKINIELKKDKIKKQLEELLESLENNSNHSYNIGLLEKINETDIDSVARKIVNGDKNFSPVENELLSSLNDFYGDNSDNEAY
jgi:hypothetical protein